MSDQKEVPRVSDDELDLVETERLIAAIYRRHQAVIVAMLSQPEPRRWEVGSLFLPNVVACSGLMESLCVSHELQMRQMRCATVQAVKAEQRGKA